MSAVERQPPNHSARRSNWMRVVALQAAAVLVAVGLLVPESEIRAKGFKLNIIVKNVSRHML